MTAAPLGLRLALTPGSRLRTTLGVLTTALGAVALLVVAAIARGELAAGNYNMQRTEQVRLILVVVAAVALPLVALIATVGRLAASLRDRRLANLRLVGLTPGQTRLVAACETGSAAVVGTTLGWLVFLAGRSALGPLQRPTVLDQVVIAVAIPLLVVALAVLPQRHGSRAALAVARRADRRPPSVLRAVPVLVGIVLCLYVVSRGHQTEYSNSFIAILMGGIAITGVGVILVVPVFVRFIAHLMLRFSSSATSTVTARRLEAQPAGVIRVVATLLIGLFLVTGARYVVAAFENTPQYLDAARDIEGAQRVPLSSSGAKADQLAKRAQEVKGVEGTLVLSVLGIRGCKFCGIRAVVATCAELEELSPELSGCVEGEPMWMQHGSGTHLPETYPALARSDTIDWFAGKRAKGGSKVVSTPVAMRSFDELPGGQHVSDLLSPLDATAVVPPGLVGDLPPDTRTDVVVLGPPGRTLIDDLATHDLHAVTSPDYETYDFVGSLRTLVVSIAAFILTVGLLAFAVAAIDRAVERRKELVALQLVGLPNGLLRRVQWLEALIPIGLGSALAVGLGALAGATYLSLDSSMGMPWQNSGMILLAAAVGSLVVAGLTVLASVQPIRPDQIRRE